MPAQTVQETEMTKVSVHSAETVSSSTTVSSRVACLTDKRQEIHRAGFVMMYFRAPYSEYDYCVDAPYGWSSVDLFDAVSLQKTSRPYLRKALCALVDRASDFYVAPPTYMRHVANTMYTWIREQEMSHVDHIFILHTDIGQFKLRVPPAPATSTPTRCELVVQDMSR